MLSCLHCLSTVLNITFRIDIQQIHSNRYTETDVCLNEFLQMSGARVVYNVSQPVGQRVQHVDVMCTECDRPHYEPLQRLHDYNCIVSDHMRRGGDGYAMLPDKRYANYTESVQEAVRNYMQQRGRVYPAIEDRIRIVGSRSLAGQADEVTPVEVDATSTAISVAVNLSVMLLLVAAIG